MLNLEKDFKEKFPQFDFTLRELQKNVITNVVEQDNTLCIMPTGGGKSVAYWMSAIEMGGMAIVVSPLTALIEEQAQKIKEHGYDVLVIHGGIDAMKQMRTLSDLAKGNITPDFIFASPEKIATDGYFEYCLKQRKDDIKLLVIDEVHCVSQWGMSFRPFYKRIPDFMDRLFGSDSWCRILALTATLNPMELNDICDAFKIARKNILKETILMRNEIQLHVKKFIKEDEKEEKFWEILKMHKGEKTLVYLYRKYGERSVEGLCEKAVERGFNAEEFHGDMGAKERMEIIEKFKNNEIDVLFATNAFGMGIDIKDIRVVIHFMIPESAEQYYQEVGRAARDGNGANAYLLYSNKNIDVKRTYYIDGSFPTEEKLRKTYENIGKRAGLRVLPYFDNEDIQECLPYYMKAGLISVVCKGFSGLSEIYDVQDPKIEQWYKSTAAKGYVKTLKKNDLEAQYLSEKIYEGVLNETIKLRKPLERWLVVEVDDTDISEERMNIMLSDIDEKRKYKHGLLDYFVYLLEDNENSQQLHQEIARYLGMDKYQLNRIYRTVDGNHVRSKSEVIICDLLAKSGIEYKYEELLEYEPGKYINPDFTVYMPDNAKAFWEHVGMLGNEKYDSDWLNKIDIYEKYFPGQLYRTYESGAISQDAENVIRELQSLKTD
ncbi:RecQ family ATP-dependent DNA helicase [Oribacterium sp. P6A1]|uniref:RecQ family ATP-dependent DNA helicase n=1 Tax=Oribacterium sp. P6A1 TaxID=1410612 RepID=UPI000A42A795|nr:RecQ family ATP-dependent DNA helicase [Oribacterium sp. P6A1]